MGFVSVGQLDRLLLDLSGQETYPRRVCPKGSPQAPPRSSMGCHSVAARGCPASD
jgi:hypothetical protein